MTDTTPNITIHRASDRGVGEYGWLSTRYSFSFADWYAPDRMGFGALRVLNDDRIQGGAGFGMHGHRDMEIITIVTHGTLRHTDNIGTDGLITAGEVQVMSAGTGILHSEVNAGNDDLKLFQLWITPHTMQVPPRYDQRMYPQTNAIETLLVAPMGHADVLTIHQDAYISRLTLSANVLHTYTLRNKDNGVYFFVVSGTITILDTTLAARDAVGVHDLSAIPLVTSDSEATVLAIEVPFS